MTTIRLDMTREPWWLWRAHHGRLRPWTKPRKSMPFWTRLKHGLTRPGASAIGHSVHTPEPSARHGRGSSERTRYTSPRCSSLSSGSTTKQPRRAADDKPKGVQQHSLFCVRLRGKLSALRRRSARGHAPSKPPAGRNALLQISEKFAKGCIALSIAEGYNGVKVRVHFNSILNETNERAR